MDFGMRIADLKSDSNLQTNYCVSLHFSFSKECLLAAWHGMVIALQRIQKFPSKLSYGREIFFNLFIPKSTICNPKFKKSPPNLRLERMINLLI